jgi:prophage regulatory protein
MGDKMKLPTPANDNVAPIKLISYKGLSEKRGIEYSRRHLQRLEDEKKFPKRVPLGENRIGWVVTEVDDWLAAKLAARAA